MFDWITPPPETQSSQDIKNSDYRRLFDPISGLAPPSSQWPIPSAKEWDPDSRLPNIPMIRILLGPDNMYYLSNAIVTQVRQKLGFPTVRPTAYDLRPYCLRFFGLLNDLAVALPDESISSVLYKVDCAVIRQGVDDISTNMKAWAISQGLLTQIDVQAPLTEHPTVVASPDKTIIADIWGL